MTLSAILIRGTLRLLDGRCDLQWKLKDTGTNCASLIVLHDDYLASCARQHADALAFATLMYMTAVPLGIALVVFLPFFALLNSMCMVLD